MIELEHWLGPIQKLQGKLYVWKRATLLKKLRDICVDKEDVEYLALEEILFLLETEKEFSDAQLRRKMENLLNALRCEIIQKWGFKI